MSSNEPDIAKRDFLKLAGAGALSAIAPQSRAAGPNAYTALKDFSFVTQDGKTIKGEDLRALVGNNPFTITFGFTGCENYCPTGKSVIGELETASQGRIRHIIINTNPVGEGHSKDMRNNYKTFVKYNRDKTLTGVNVERAIILYPADRNTGQLDNYTAISASINIGNTTRRDDYKNHSGTLNLYAANGQHMEKVNLSANSAPKKVAEELMQKLGRQR